ncbi:hypothetical protein BD310DRAFT_908307 [Dichomitus squalens]|uniref:Uncharacterized protein n=1 Tax=Dichomitus squalens TaxID=114155 RepID=A0A4Q9PN07_9APHY|nr:hypothetical protein BD310DRAFT_908307 [Dichomitus squalens]
MLVTYMLVRRLYTYGGEGTVNIIDEVLQDHIGRFMVIKCHGGLGNQTEKELGFGRCNTVPEVARTVGIQNFQYNIALVLRNFASAESFAFCELNPLQDILLSSDSKDDVCQNLSINPEVYVRPIESVQPTKCRKIVPSDSPDDFQTLTVPRNKLQRQVDGTNVCGRTKVFRARLGEKVEPGLKGV